MVIASTFEPVTAKRMREGSSAIAAAFRVIRNPVEVWSDQMYRERFFDGSLLSQRIVHTSDPQTFQDALLTHQSAFTKSDIQQRLLSAATGNGLLTAEGHDWKTQRKAAAPAFRHDRLYALLPDMNQAARKAATRLQRQSGAVDVMPFMIDATFEIIAKTLLSSDESSLDYAQIEADVAVFLDQLGRVDLFDIIPGLSAIPRPWGAKGRAAVKRMREVADRAILTRRSSSTPFSADATADLLGLLLSATDPETGAGLSDRELRDSIITFIGAGHETTSLALTWALYLLANSGEWQDRLRQEAFAVCGDGPVERAHIRQLVSHEWVIKEAMRLYPPAPAMGRTAIRDVELTHLKLKAGDQLVLAVFPMHRHEDLWERPGAFDPERFSPERSKDHHRYQYIPFSGGPRICIGMQFAMMEALTILAHLVRRVEVSPCEDFTPYPRSRITLRPERGMVLQVHPSGSS
ncbi:MAG: cytochrome P450 [Pseudomonadota bacterium]